MTRSVLRLLCAAALVAAGLAALQASTPKFWLVSSAADVLRGDLTQISVDEAGRLTLGPVVTQVHDAATPFVWDLAAGPDGSIFLGTGNDGHVLRVDAAGKASVWFDAPEMEVHALASAPDGSLYAATSPDGKVYRIDTSGRSRVAFDPDEKYIWALAIDGRGRVWAGTGEKGRVYRLDPGADRAVVVHTSTAQHVTALAIDKDGLMVIGTESPGRLARLREDGQAFVIVDSPYREVRSIRVDTDGTIFAAMVNGKPAAPPAQATPATPAAPAREPAASVSVSAEITSVTVIDTSSAPAATSGTTATGTGGTPKGAVMRVGADGLAETVWESRDDTPYDIWLDAPGTLAIATGNSGRLYQATGTPGRATLVTRVDGQQATALLSAGAHRYVATSNPGRLFRVGLARAAEGTWLSDVRDAASPSTWGTIAWRAVPGAGGQIQVFTRSGNTASPQDGWSGWSGPYAQAEGHTIASPAARYLQWKVVLKDGGAGTPPPALLSLSVAYQQRNVRPHVAEITIHPQGVVFQRPYPTGEPEIAGLEGAWPEFRFPIYSMPLGTAAARGSGPALGRRLYQKSLRALAWKAEDANDDRLIYDVLYRRLEDTAWQPLRTAILDELMTWDTTSVPDGTYIVRIVASDRLTNTPSSALAGEADSISFDVDNTPPVMTTGPAPARPGVVTIDVRDAHSVVDRVEYSINAGPWQLAFPIDGAADSKAERYEIAAAQTQGQSAPHVVVRATDTMNNVATMKVGTAQGQAPAAPARR